MARLRFVVALLLCSIAGASVPVYAQDPIHSETVSQDAELESVIRLLLAVIETLSDYRAIQASPPVFQVPQHLIETKVCDTPCNVTAAYIPGEGIYLAGNLDPVRKPMDRAALLHELVHHLQLDHPKFAGLTPCERARAKEREAYAIHNAYLAKMGRSERAVFYEGDFDCDEEPPARLP